MFIVVPATAGIKWQEVDLRLRGGDRKEGAIPTKARIKFTKNSRPPFITGCMSKSAYVYIMSNRPNATLYIGVTSSLVQRVWQHKTNAMNGFTARYSCKMLVYFESFEDITTAIAREKALKKWNRKWKLRLIEGQNPNWHDLWDDIV